MWLFISFATALTAGLIAGGGEQGDVTEGKLCMHLCIGEETAVRKKKSADRGDTEK